MTGDRLRVLLVEPEQGLGAALAAALGRLGAEVTWHGERPPLDALPHVRVVAGPRAAISPRSYDAAVDFGARDAAAPALLASVLRGRVGLVVQCGTWEVYAGARDGGEPTAAPGLPPLPVPEDAPKAAGPALQAEEALWREHGRGDYPAAVLRLAAPYGPGVALAREWWVVARLRAGVDRLALADGGRHLLHRVYVDNAVHAVVRALDHPREVEGRAFNVGDQHVPDAAELCRALAAALDRPLAVVPPPAGGAPPCPWAAPRPVVLDTSALRLRLGYAEPVPWAEAAARTARWLWELPEADVGLRLAPSLARWGA